MQETPQFGNFEDICANQWLYEVPTVNQERVKHSRPVEDTHNKAVKLTVRTVFHITRLYWLSFSVL
jgi:hypothetical protein